MGSEHLVFGLLPLLSAKTGVHLLELVHQARRRSRVLLVWRERGPVPQHVYFLQQNFIVADKIRMGHLRVWHYRLAVKMTAMMHIVVQQCNAC